ncbi:MAG TPA: glycosyltransferase family 4 protein [Thermodesulfobacteriota bacterium]|nr:glycosyltransferase family 4 protein [Thermodesulfobacteriota bacterium]
MRKNLKILLPVHVFFPKHFYGTETYTLELAKCLKAMGHDPVVLTAIPFGEEGEGTLLSQYEYDDIPVFCIDMNSIPYKRFKDTYYRPELEQTLTTVISQVKPDLAHVTHLIHHTATLLEVLQKAHIPTIATLTDFYGICFTNILQGYNGTLCHGPNKNSTNCLSCYLRITDQFARNKPLSMVIKHNLALRTACAFLPHLMRFPRFRNTILAAYVQDITQRLALLRPLYRHYSLMIAPTQFLYDAYVKNNFYPEKIRKINFGIDRSSVKEFQKPKKKPDTSVRFGYIGQMAPHKGVDLLIEAFQKTRGDNKSLILYGSQDQDPPYAKKLLDLTGGNSAVRFAGTFPREELPKRLSDIDILAIPSRWHENSPLALLYALATRTPAIVSDVKGMTEFVKNDYNGFTFSLNRLDQLQAILQGIIDEPAIIERLSKNTRYEKDIFDHAAEVYALYEAILSSPKRY